MNQLLDTTGSRIKCGMTTRMIWVFQGRLGILNRCVTKQAIKRSGLQTITIENDATYVESQKQESLIGYKGQGYMPTIGVIPELDLIIADEFRDANVAPNHNAIGFFDKCLKVIPKSVSKIRTRLDGAYYQQDFMTYLEKKKIAYTISADKSAALLQVIEALPNSQWSPLKDEQDFDTSKDYTELYWGPAQDSRQKSKQVCRRYLVTRIRMMQAPLEGVYTKEQVTEVLEEQRKNCYAAIVTSDEVKPADEIILWHYKKGGHIEKVHDRTKNDLAAGKMPCAEFGANAAWFRINCLAWNLIRIMQIEALPKPFQSCYLKKLRLWLFNVAGKVIKSGRKIYLRISGCETTCEMYALACKKIWLIPNTT